MPPTTAAVALCHAYIAVPATKESEPKRQEELTKLLATHSDKAVVVQAVGDCYFMAGNYEPAVKAYRRTLELQPGNLLAQNNLALALSELPDKLDEAHKVLATALATDSKSLDLLDTQASLHLVEKHAELAMEVLNKIVEQNPDNPTTQLHLAIAYDELQNAEAARRSLFTATALGVQGQVLSPRDKKSLEHLQQRYMASEAEAVAKTSAVSQSNPTTN